MKRLMRKRVPSAYWMILGVGLLIFHRSEIKTLRLLSMPPVVRGSIVAVIS